MSFEVQKVTPPTPELTSYQVGKPDVTEALGVSMEALRWLGLRASEEQLQQDYKSVASLGYDGRLLPVLAQGVIDFEDLLAGAEGKRPEGVPAVYRYDQHRTGCSNALNGVNCHTIALNKTIWYKGIDMQKAKRFKSI